MERPSWPHPKWGKDDAAGASNWITPEKILDAASWFKDGKVYEIGRVYKAGMPELRRAGLLACASPAARRADRSAPTSSSITTSSLATEIGQVGTQFDGLGHIGVQRVKGGDKDDMRFYNGFTRPDVDAAYGLKKLGIEHLQAVLHPWPPPRHRGGQGRAGWTSERRSRSPTSISSAEAGHAGEPT